MKYRIGEVQDVKDGASNQTSRDPRYRNHTGSAAGARFYSRCWSHQRSSHPRSSHLRRSCRGPRDQRESRAWSG